MSYDDDERRREYNRELDRQADERERRRRQEDEETRRRENQRRDRDTDEGMALLREGNLGRGFNKLGAYDAAIEYYDSRPELDAQIAGDYLPSPSLNDAEESHTDAEANVLNQLDAFGFSQHSAILSIYRDPALMAATRAFMAALTATSLINEEIQRETQNQAQLDLRATEEMAPTSYLNMDKNLVRINLERLETQKYLLQLALGKLNQESKDRLRKSLSGEQS